MISEQRIIELRDELLPSQGEAFDCIAFARAIEAETKEHCAKIIEEEMREAGSTYYRGVFGELAAKVRE